MKCLLTSAASGTSSGGESAPAEPADPDPLVPDLSGRSDDGDGPVAGEVYIVDATGRLAAPQVEWLRAHALKALRHLGAGGEVHVRILDDGRMDEAHRRYSGIEGTTDVLTFDLRDGRAEGGGGGSTEDGGADAGPLDTDMLICLDEAERQGSAHGHGTLRELLLYIVHGVLHCLGYDDHDQASHARMHRREDEILTAIGIGATYGQVNADPSPIAHAPPDPGTAEGRGRTG